MVVLLVMKKRGTMIMMIRNLGRHLVESFKNLKRNGWMSFASISAVTVVLLLLGCFMLFVSNVNKLAQDIQKNVTVSVFVDLGTTKKQRATLETQLEALPNVSKVTFSSKEEQYKKLVKQMGDDWDVFSSEDNPLYDVYEVQAQDPSQTSQIKVAAEKLKHVAEASYGGTETEKILSIASNVKKWGTIAAIILLILAVFLISNTIRMTIISRRDEIKIMRLVGAKNGYIRWPFFLEGAWIGLIGALVPIGILWLLYPHIYNWVNPTLLQGHYAMLTTNQVMGPLALLLIVTGMLIGALGSILSMRRFLKI